ncbi:MAG TPA: hypothetical protein VMM35_11375 [Longimicrobiales bacterium]|nr:hypothetical protein [Longimicrobiales bacterium]
MNPIVACAESALRQHPHPALRLSELVELVAEQLDRTLDEARLRSALESYPDRFRLLDPWRGPWRATLAGSCDELASHDVWVVAVMDPTQPPIHAGTAALKLRESVRWLGRGIDPRSPREVSRWYAIALAERAIREAVVKRAA